VGRQHAPELDEGASITAPCSVKAFGNLRRPPWAKLEVANCDLKSAVSSGVNWKRSWVRAALAARAVCG